MGHIINVATTGHTDERRKADLGPRNAPRRGDERSQESTAPARRQPCCESTGYLSGAALAVVAPRCFGFDFDFTPIEDLTRGHSPLSDS